MHANWSNAFINPLEMRSITKFVLVDFNRLHTSVLHVLLMKQVFIILETDDYRYNIRTIDSEANAYKNVMNKLLHVQYTKLFAFEVSFIY